jgi:hypothetical protein
VDTLTASVRDALIAEGACPATAEALAVDFVYRARNRVARDKRELDAMQQLFKGADKLAEQQGCHRVTVYRRAKRARAKLQKQQPSATATP